ncbi:MAG: class I SAM-dependent methyltransferase, partial [Eubacteriaceae bacterium]|nr:class I SAM-dependent methyltransferase [Eubacteriaceae bacterium]
MLSLKPNPSPEAGDFGFFGGGLSQKKRKEYPMNNVNKTLYIPLSGKALVSEKGIILNDPKAEEIWKAEGFAIGGKSESKWLAYYMGMRSAVFDDYLKEKLTQYPSRVVLHPGCGMDSRILRVGCGGHLWYDLDFPEVISERRKYFSETENYRMISSDATDTRWLKEIPPETGALVVMEGISMYLAPEKLNRLLGELTAHFGEVCLLMDCYTALAAKISKYKNPVNEVGVSELYGIDDPSYPVRDTGLKFVREHSLTPEGLINCLTGFERLF